jgi:hypothetical protein
MTTLTSLVPGQHREWVSNTVKAPNELGPRAPEAGAEAYFEARALERSSDLHGQYRR